MLDSHDATRVVLDNCPRGKIQSFINYKDRYIFQIFRDDPYEEDSDPYYSVHKETGVFEEFSILTDGDTAEIVSLFAASRR